MRQSEYLPVSTFEDAQWRKAVASEPDRECVEFARVGEVIGIRDSKVHGGPILQFNRQEIAAMLDAVKNGEFDYLT